MERTGVSPVLSLRYAKVKIAFQAHSSLKVDLSSCSCWWHCWHLEGYRFGWSSHWSLYWLHHPQSQARRYRSWVLHSHKLIVSLLTLFSPGAWFRSVTLHITHNLLRGSDHRITSLLKPINRLSKGYACSGRWNVCSPNLKPKATELLNSSFLLPWPIFPFLISIPFSKHFISNLAWNRFPWPRFLNDEHPDMSMGIGVLYLPCIITFLMFCKPSDYTC